jgi:hypothetical protein
MTVRQVFYQLVSQGAIAGTEDEYKTKVTPTSVVIATDGRRGR